MQSVAFGCGRKSSRAAIPDSYRYSVNHHLVFIYISFCFWIRATNVVCSRLRNYRKGSSASSGGSVCVNIVYAYDITESVTSQSDAGRDVAVVATHTDDLCCCCCDCDAALTPAERFFVVGLCAFYVLSC